MNCEASCTNQLAGQYSEYYSTNSVAVHTCSKRIICPYPNNVFGFGYIPTTINYKLIPMPEPSTAGMLHTVKYRYNSTSTLLFVSNCSTTNTTYTFTVLQYSPATRKHSQFTDGVSRQQPPFQESGQVSESHFC